MQIVFIVSTNGGLLSKLLENQYVLESTHSIVSDRHCGAINVAKHHNLRFDIISAKNNEDFSTSLDKLYPQKDLIFISFYTKLLTSVFLKPRIKKVFNCHPSILPIAPGLNGFEDTLKSNSLFLGCTIHEVDLGVDTGMPVIQASYPLDRSLTYNINRDTIFTLQYYTALQFIRWAIEGRIFKDTYWSVKGSKFYPSVFSPNLDKDFFNFFNLKNNLKEFYI